MVSLFFLPRASAPAHRASPPPPPPRPPRPSSETKYWTQPRPSEGVRRRRPGRRPGSAAIRSPPLSGVVAAVRGRRPSRHPGSPPSGSFSFFSPSAPTSGFDLRRPHAAAPSPGRLRPLAAGPGPERQIAPQLFRWSKYSAPAILSLTPCPHGPRRALLLGSGEERAASRHRHPPPSLVLIPVILHALQLRSGYQRHPVCRCCPAAPQAPLHQQLLTKVLALADLVSMD
jgi:hypothetical protein